MAFADTTVNLEPEPEITPGSEAEMSISEPEFEQTVPESEAEMNISEPEFEQTVPESEAEMDISEPEFEQTVPESEAEMNISEPEFEQTVPEVEINISEPEFEQIPIAEAEAGSLSYTEIVFPPFVFIVLIIIVLLMLSLIKQRSWWKKKVFPVNKTSAISIIEVSEKQTSDGFITKTCGNLQAVRIIGNSSSFFSKRDPEIIEKFKEFQNNPIHLAKISVTILLSLAFCPVTIYLYPVMVRFFWKSDTKPNVNDAVACFLMPAGMVYAIAFGFTFQEVLSKTQLLQDEFRLQVDALVQIKNIVTLHTKLDGSCKRSILKYLKEYVIGRMFSVMNKKTIDIYQGTLWEIIGNIRTMEEQQGNQAMTECEKNMNTIMFQQILLLETQLKRKSSLHNSLKMLQWVFLLCLGFITFFGCLLITADSYRLELTMCILTVLSISAFSYILADFDSPFHGFFTIDLSPYVKYIEELEVYHNQLCWGK